MVNNNNNHGPVLSPPTGDEHQKKQEKDGLVSQKQHSDYQISQEYALSWSEVKYTVKKNRACILNGVTGRAAPGELTAILGPSGCGKSTLLEILGDRISRGKFDGEVALNGSVRDSNTFRAVASYVAQDETLQGNFTVYETLMYAARLNSSMTTDETKQCVEDAIEHMGLDSCRSKIVGDVFRRGISVAERRRLCIGIALVSKPSILLLDDPTSGLDSTSSYNVMEYIRNLSHHGRTIVCTVDQPSSAVYKLFDNVTFMTQGETVYSGPRPHAIEFFHEQGYACEQFCNPADYFIELINTDFPGSADVSKMIVFYNKSECASKIAEDIVADQALGGVDSSNIAVRSASGMSQFFTLLQRSAMNNLRNPGMFWVRIALYTILAAIIGTMYVAPTKYRGMEVDDLAIVPMLFYVQAFLVFMSVCALPFIVEELEVFGRERANGLNTVSFVLSDFIATLPALFIISLVSTVLVVLLAELNSFGWFLLNLFLSLVIAESLMRLIGALVPHYIIGITLAAGLYGLFMVCEGVMVPKKAIPDYWIWVYYMAFHSYSFRSFMYGEFGESTDINAKVVLNKYDVENVNISNDMIVLACYAVVVQILYTLVLYFFHKGRR